jgi:hypothetical protein
MIRPITWIVDLLHALYAELTKPNPVHIRVPPREHKFREIEAKYRKKMKGGR